MWYTVKLKPQSPRITVASNNTGVHENMRNQIYRQQSCLNVRVQMCAQSARQYNFFPNCKRLDCYQKENSVAQIRHRLIINRSDCKWNRITLIEIIKTVQCETCSSYTWSTVSMLKLYTEPRVRLVPCKSFLYLFQTIALWIPHKRTTNVVYWPINHVNKQGEKTH